MTTLTVNKLCKLIDCTNGTKILTDVTRAYVTVAGDVQSFIEPSCVAKQNRHTHCYTRKMNNWAPSVVCHTQSLALVTVSVAVLIRPNMSVMASVRAWKLTP